VRLDVVGGVPGLLLAVGLAMTVQRLGLLVEVPPYDPVAFGGMTLLMGAVLLAASYLPARRASSLDPASTLRSE
jgi:ABC-type lipoprotein release transport system permease subunit